MFLKVRRENDESHTIDCAGIVLIVAIFLSVLNISLTQRFIWLEPSEGKIATSDSFDIKKA